MKLKALLKKNTVVAFVGCLFLIISPFSKISIFAMNVNVQFGNSISGIVFGSQRQPVNDINIELLDEFSRMIARARTTGSGRYIFNNLRAGRYQIRVLTHGTNYEEQTQEVEIDNLQVATGTGGIRTLGYENKQQDIYLRIPKSKNRAEVTDIVFVQDVPNPARKVYDEAISASNNNRKKEAVNFLKEAISLFPEYYLALESLGKIYVQDKQFKDAEQVLNRAVQVNPKGYSAWYVLAYSYYALKNSEGALNASKNAAELASTSADSVLLFGVCLKQAGRYEEAEAQLKKANDLVKGKMAEIHWQLALLYGNHLKRYAQAADELELFLKIQPESRDKESIIKLIKTFRNKVTK